MGTGFQTPLKQHRSSRLDDAGHVLHLAEGTRPVRAGTAGYLFEHKDGSNQYGLSGVGTCVGFPDSHYVKQVLRVSPAEFKIQTSYCGKDELCFVAGFRCQVFQHALPGFPQKFAKTSHWSTLEKKRATKLSLPSVPAVRASLSEVHK